MAQQPTPDFRVKRVYDEPDAADGTRVLVDRLWPRGISKQQAHIDEWARDVAPSTELRKWFHADLDGRQAEFARRYRAELADEPHRQALARLRELAAAGPVTLVTAVKDPMRSQVPVLLEQLRD
ncbi:DUF488 domain-containing protein [Nocardia transvalensis]|uniref:DUF488 domain-containing protein n=1 Tax=Nocardia transvalensis TaxID=37333 RepID=UPI001894D404|nr:DUF488 family protein [Nocardia transvalensis]MBF6330906.1 DUF488 family protein [Nocardia transvalensis]